MLFVLYGELSPVQALVGAHIWNIPKGGTPLNFTGSHVMNGIGAQYAGVGENHPVL